MSNVRRLLLIASALMASSATAASANVIVSDQLANLPLRDDLQRNDPPAAFSSSGMGAGKWSTPTAYQQAAASRGGAYNTGGRLGYGSPSGWAAAYWNAQVFSDKGNGDGVKAKLTAPLGNGEAIALWLNQPSPTAVISGYELYIVGTKTPNQGTAYLLKWTNGSMTILASSSAITNASPTSGTIYALVERAGEITAWGSVGGGEFINPPPYKVTDTSPYKEGFAGLQIYGAEPSLDNFSAGPLPPATPIPNATSPVSPGSSTTPKIIGSAEPGATVNLYTNSSCTGSPTASGSASSFASPGITVTVQENATTTFYATAVNSEGVSSPCSTSSAIYAEDSSLPAAPTFSWTAPTSPAKSTAPKIAGGAENGSTVKLYANVSCTGTPAATGSASSFASPGLGVSAAENSNTTFHATATDAAGNVSPCSGTSITYANKAKEILWEGSRLTDFNETYACTPERITEVPDPLSSGKTVLKFTVYNNDVPGHGCSGITPTNDPRAWVVSPEFIRPGDEFWLRGRFFIPADFPNVTDWMTLLEVYGQPFNGTSPWRVEVKPNEGQSSFTYQRNSTYNWDTPWAVPAVKGQWVEVLTHEKFAAEGFLEEWLNGQQITFFNPGTSPWNPNNEPATKKLEMQTVDASDNGGVNSIRFGQYRKAGMFEVGSLYFDFAKVGTTKESVGG